MDRKIYPNDPCPCGSGKKYKKCCGAKKNIRYDDLKRSDLQLEDYIIEKLCEDIAFLENALQLIIGPYGYLFCKENSEEIKREYLKDRLNAYVKSDKAKVYLSVENSDKQLLRKVRPYGGVNPEEQQDIISMLEKGHICYEGCQIELFHAYLMDYLIRRFDDYYYIPSEKAIEGREFGSFAHRGYDFLLGITLYLELQLGVHIYLHLANPFIPADVENSLCERFGLEELQIDDKIKKAMVPFLMGYANVLTKIGTMYNAANEVELYHFIGAYAEDEYADRKAIIQPDFYKPYPYQYNYMGYLLFLVSATCFNSDWLYNNANALFPQCDFLKYLFGLESIIELFEEKKSEHRIKPTDYLNLDEIKAFEDETGLKLKTQEHVYDRKDLYHIAVFWFMDELNGLCHHFKPIDLVYEDFAEINEDDFTIKEGLRKINPARKSTKIKATRKLRMELYNILNGKCFTLRDGVKAGDINEVGLVGKYQILPWLSNGKEKTVHSKPFDRSKRPCEDLFGNIEKRQAYLTMEYRLTAIPVNCIEEFLNPDVFYSWEQRNELLKLTTKQNEELHATNDILIKHIHLNEELVRNLSHSSANYLNSDKLAQIGIQLHNAVKDDPAIEQLHYDGLLLLLQAEHETFLRRSLDSLAIRCRADGQKLKDTIREGLSETEGESIYSPLDFAVKTVVSRILTREDDIRSRAVRKKFHKSDKEWYELRESFISEVLADRESALEWCNKYLCVIKIEISEKWLNIRIIEDRAFFNLLVEILTEELLNAFSHGDVNEEITITFGESDVIRRKGRFVPTWYFVRTINVKGEVYKGGRQTGIKTLGATLLLLNSNKRGVEYNNLTDNYIVTAWLESNLLRPSAEKGL